MIIGSGFFLGLLLITTINPLFYAIAFTLYSVVTGYTNYYAIKEIDIAIRGSRTRLNKELNHKERGIIACEYLKGVDVLEVYFTKRPQAKRFILIAAFSLIGLGFGVSWEMTQSKILGFITYFFFFSIIFLSEIFVNIWRIKRDNQLRPIESEIDELKREYGGSKVFEF